MVGTCIISRIPIRESVVEYYHGDPNAVPNAIDRPEDFPDDAAVAASINCALSLVDIEKDGAVFSVATTHFLWSRGGRLNMYQRASMRKLLRLLEKAGEFVLTGDFNAPRGGEIFGMLATKYKDNVPSRYKTSIDASLHRAGKEHAGELADKMVDGLFSTPAYVVSNVELISGVSDHCAIVANVTAS